MKVRTGWVSNSSSSSFIISQNKAYWGGIDVYSDDNVDWSQIMLDELKASIKRYSINSIKNYKKQYKKWFPEVTEEELQKAYEQHKEHILRRYDESQFKEELYISELTEEEKEDLSYWYPGHALQDGCKVIHGGENFIPERVASKFVKKYDIDDYCLHMG